MRKIPAILLALALTTSLAACSGGTGTTATKAPASQPPAASVPPASTAPAPATSDLKVGVFYYQYSDVYISSVRTEMDAKLTALGVNYKNYDGGNNQANQTDQINTAITDGMNLLVVNIVETSSPDAAQGAVDAAKAAGIPIVFFNREIADEVVASYDKCAFVGTDAPEAGHMQGDMIAAFLLADGNYDAVDLNKDGKISYVMFKGQEANAEAEYRTQFAVEDCDTALTAAGKEALSFYDSKNSAKYLVDQTGGWTAQAATDYMTTILAEYSEANGNMVEMVIANNDGMAEGAVAALQTGGYNTGEDGATVIPVFGVDATENAKQLIKDGKMTGTIKQDAVGMADSITTLISNVMGGSDLTSNTGAFKMDSDVAKVRVPYGVYTGE